MEWSKNDKVRFYHTQGIFIDEVGILQLNMVENLELHAGNVGYLITGIKVSKEIKVGDTVILAKYPTTDEIKGLRKAYGFRDISIDNDDFEDLRDSLWKITIKWCIIDFRAWELCCTRIWFSMWLPGHASLRYHPGKERVLIKM